MTSWSPASVSIPKALWAQSCYQCSHNLRDQDLGHSRTSLDGQDDRSVRAITNCATKYFCDFGRTIRTLSIDVCWYQMPNISLAVILRLFTSAGFQHYLEILSTPLCTHIFHFFQTKVPPFVRKSLSFSGIRGCITFVHKKKPIWSLPQTTWISFSFPLTAVKAFKNTAWHLFRGFCCGRDSSLDTTSVTLDRAGTFLNSSLTMRKSSTKLVSLLTHILTMFLVGQGPCSLFCLLPINVLLRAFRNHLFQVGDEHLDFFHCDSLETTLLVIFYPLFKLHPS